MVETRDGPIDGSLSRQLRSRPRDGVEKDAIRETNRHVATYGYPLNDRKPPEIYSSK